MSLLQDGKTILFPEITQQTFTCSNSTIVTIEKGVKYVPS